MKRGVFLLISLVLYMGNIHAQQMLENNMAGIRLHFNTPRVEIATDSFSVIHLSGYSNSGNLGSPALPVKSAYITLPFCQSVDIEIVHAVYDTISLSTPLYPRQPSACKNGMPLPYFFNEDEYNSDQYIGSPLIQLELLGLSRDHNLALLHYSPIRYNPIKGKAIVCRSADITLHYRDVDYELTQQTYNRYHTPAFGTDRSINSLPLTKGLTNGIVRLTILAGNKFKKSTALQEFATWKRTQGLMVDIIFVENNAITAKSKLKELYDNATYTSPAPTYILLVGDHEQVPGFQSDLPPNNLMHDYNYLLDDHFTDFYYTTLSDNDQMADCYIGRFSVTDTSQLRSVVEKTLLYEKYLFEDDSYLSNAVLIAGVDELNNYNPYDNAFRCADPAMDYINYHYVNPNHGFSSVSYYKNNSFYAPDGVNVTGSNRQQGLGEILYTLYNKGVGLINYTAHGDIDQWVKPNFWVGQVNQMSNYGKPSFMIGNCCLTNHFDTPQCFGEALLRRQKNAGAVAYIGCTNSSFWDEDFFWTVGHRDNISNQMKLDYDDNHRGAYDHLFHTHNEGIGQSVYTAGRMIHSGVMAIASISGKDSWTTSIIPYYKEIYLLMGDPTLLPWLGQAKELPMPQIDIKPNEEELTISAPRGAYVAIVSKDSLQVMAASHAWNDGLAYLPLVEEGYDSCFVSITAQGYKPFFIDLQTITAGLASPDATDIRIAPNPAVGHCTVSATGLTSIRLTNITGLTLKHINPSSDSYELSLHDIPAGFYLLIVETRQGTTVEKLIVQ